MRELPKKLKSKLLDRESKNALRTLNGPKGQIDFSSNDYLGLSRSKALFEHSHEYLAAHNIIQNGATGSRLISGNHPLYNTTELALCAFHNSEAALIFNSGFDANIGFFASVPQRGDVIFYDELIHASIRDGIAMSNSRSYKFRHNDLDDLMQKYQVERERSIPETEIYIATESVFSMDGDSPDLPELADFCSQNNCHLIVDEAHAVGVHGKQGKGLIVHHGLEDQVFARLVTFGKALGCHGAVILGCPKLIEFLINFARSFIYTTALPAHSLATIHYAHEMLFATDKIAELGQNIVFFKDEVKRHNLSDYFISSNSAIHCCVISGNENVKEIAKQLQKNKFDVRPILSPTVPQGQERLRFCLHAYNSETEISEVLKLLATFIH
jgi:8-amino-7-oxononanoate synthase